VSNQTANKEGKKESKKFWLLRMREKQKKLFNYGKYAFFLVKLVFSHSYDN